MAPSRVAVIGGGIAGATTAVFLKLAGHEPTIFERNADIPDAGLDISIQHSDLSLLARIPGLLEHLGGAALVEWYLYSELVSEMGALDVGPRWQHERTRLPSASFSRSILQSRLVEFAMSLGVKVRWGHELVGLQQDDAGVTIKFANGGSERVGFVVGCDGLHSATRRCLFGRQSAMYSGVSQYGANSQPEFRTRHLKRVVLLDNAAQSMNSCVGQEGAFESVRLLAELLERHSWTVTESSVESLDAIFTAFQGAHTAQTKEARAQGDLHNTSCGLNELSALLAETTLESPRWLRGS